MNGVLLDVSRLKDSITKAVTLTEEEVTRLEQGELIVEVRLPDGKLKGCVLDFVPQSFFDAAEEARKDPGENLRRGLADAA